MVAGGDLYAALTPGDPLSNYGPAANIYDISAILNPDNGLANVLANFSDPKADGRESINGTEAVRVTGTVSADAVNKIAPQLKAEGPVPEPRGSPRTGTTPCCRPSSNPRPETASP